MEKKLNNLTGWIPVGDRIFVLPEVVAEVTSGGIHIPENVARKERYIQDVGVIIAIGSEAWNTLEYENSEPWAQIGDEVLFDRYSGKLHLGDNEKEFRILNDKAVIARRMRSDEVQALRDHSWNEETDGRNWVENPVRREFWKSAKPR